MPTLFHHAHGKAQEAKARQAKFIERFGKVDGIRLFLAGLSYGQALEAYAADQSKRIKRLRKQLAAVSTN
ncbi:MAG: hypothetical protein AAFV88_13320 [Planctomycetota bacterium]